MPEAINIEKELQELTPLDGRSGDTTEEEVAAAFATLSEYEQGGVFAGSFTGESEWERHPNGDELVHVLAGETELTILSDKSRDILTLSAGMLTVVPRSRWHKFNSKTGVTLLTMTPQPTDHSNEEDPRGD